jgi:hypothetical protein
MYINGVFSNLGAWKILQESYQTELEDIRSILNDITFDTFLEPLTVNTSEIERIQKWKLNSNSLHSRFDALFMNKGWASKIVNIPSYSFLSRQDEKNIRRSLDMQINKVGLDISLGKVQFLESKLFSDMPYFMHSRFIEVMVFLVPMRNHDKNIVPPYNSFESVTTRLRQIEPTILRYPFIILGFSDLNTEIQEFELTSEIDQFLVSRIGIPFQEMIIRNEMDNYDFKVVLPDSDKCAKEICAMANQANGGILIVGINKQGFVEGVSKGSELDQIQQRISGIAHNSVSPRPEVSLRIFDIPNNTQKCILIIDIKEIENKPCMAHERIYIRKASTAVAAGPDEIRRLLSY